MVEQEHIDQLVGVQGYEVAALHFGEDDESGEKELVIELARAVAGYLCHCGRAFDTFYDCAYRMVRDLPYGPHKRSCLCFHRVRVDYPDCGVVTEELDFCSPWATYTKRLAADVALSCRETRSLKAIAEQCGLDWRTVKEIDKLALEKELPHPSEIPASLLAVDEFSARKRHRYATTVIDAGEKAEEKHKGAYKGTRHILLSDHENLKGWQQERLSELLALNRRLFTAYLLKDDLKRLRQYRSPYHAERFFRGWYLRAVYSQIEPLKKFARMLKKRLPGILAHCRYPIHTSVLEGINNKIKAI